MHTNNNFYMATHTLKSFGSKVTHQFKSLNERVDGMSSPSMSIKEQVFFMKRLAFLIKANVPILESLHMLKDQSMSKRQQRIVLKVIDDVSNGQTLSKSFGKFPRVFGDFGINIIKVGETSGTLSQNLEYLADELKKRHALQRKVTGAFIYPAVITVATLGITAFLMLYLFPKIMPVFSSLHMTLPLSTRIVIGATGFLQHWGISLVAVIIATFIGVTVALRKSKKFHFLFDRWLIGVPLVGTVVRQYNLASINRTLGLLLKSGITLSEALPMTADTTRNLVYRAEIMKVARGVTKGEQVSKYLGKNRMLFPDVVPQMVSVGERSGNLSNTLIYLSDMFDAEVDDFTKNISSLIEPAMMVIMGVLVGFIAVSIITPIYGITQNIGH